MAVALEEGLVVPVIRNADRLIAARAGQTKPRAVRTKAQKKKLFPLDYEGGTFTVSNLGMFGVDSFIAIINPPQCAILAVGQVAPRVVPHGEGIAVRPIMTMSSFRRSPRRRWRDRCSVSAGGQKTAGKA